jgi:hypothetical protein
VIDALKARLTAAIVARLNPRVSAEIRRLQTEVGRLTTDNARLQQEVRMMSDLRAKGR